MLLLLLLDTKCIVIMITDKNKQSVPCHLICTPASDHISRIDTIHTLSALITMIVKITRMGNITEDMLLTLLPFH